MSAVDALVVAAAAVFWLATAVKLVEVRRRPDRAQLALAITVACVATSTTLLVPTVHTALGATTGVANIAEPLARTAVMTGACAGQLLLATLASGGGPRRRIDWRVMVLLSALLAMWVLFALSPVESPTLRFTATYGDEPGVVAYLLTSLSYFAYALADIGRTSHRYARAGSGWLSGGLRLIAWGSALGIVYVGVKVGALVAIAISRPVPTELEATVGRVLALFAAALVIAGASLPAVGRRVAPAIRWTRDYRDNRRLYRLWSDLVSVHPEFALDPASSAAADRLRVRDVGLRLYRRVIEIRDGRLAIREYLDADVHGRARDLADVNEHVGVDARGEAAMLAAAICDARLGVVPRRPWTGSDIEGGDWQAELDWLRRVARAYSRERTRAGAVGGRSRTAAETTR